MYTSRCHYLTTDYWTLNILVYKYKSSANLDKILNTLLHVNKKDWKTILLKCIYYLFFYNLHFNSK